MDHERNILLDHAHVARANARVTRTGILDKFTRWKPSPIAGRPSFVSERALLVGLMLLAQEQSPLSIASLAELLHHRLNDESRRLLGMPREGNSGSAAEGKRWYDRTHTAFQRMVALMDPYPRSASATSFTGIRALLDDHETQNETTMKSRLNDFTQAFLHMTFAEQSRHLRRSDRIDLAIDQGFVQSPMSTGFSRRDLDRRVAEEFRPLRASGSFRPTEVFAGWCHLGGTEAGELLDRSAFGWGWMANIALRVDLESPADARFPALVVAATLSMPNVGVSAEAINLMRASLRTGLRPGIVDADKAYFATLPIERLHLPTAELGFTPSTDYPVDRLPHDSACTQNERQAFTYGSAKWEAFRQHARSTVESFSADFRDLSTRSNGTPTRRRIRGFAAAQVLTSILLAEYNRRVTAHYLRTGFRSQGHDWMPANGNRPRSAANFGKSANEPTTGERRA